MKKTVCAIAALTMLVSSGLVAQSRTKGRSGSRGSSGKTIKVWESDDSAKTYIMWAAKEFMKTHKGVRIEYEHVESTDARAKIEWGPFQYSSYADPKISMGYVFVGKSPYFCIKIPSTKSNQRKGDTQIEYGGNLLYFTRAQAKDLVDAIAEEEIQSAVQSQMVVLPADDDYDSGEYEETDLPAEENTDYEEN